MTVTAVYLDEMKEHVYKHQELRGWLNVARLKGMLGVVGGAIAGSAAAPALTSSLAYVGPTGLSFWSIFCGGSVGVAMAGPGTLLLGAGVAVMIGGVAISAENAIFLGGLPANEQTVVKQSVVAYLKAVAQFMKHSNFDDEVDYYKALACTIPPTGAETRARLLAACGGLGEHVPDAQKEATDLSKLRSVWEQVVHKVNPALQCDTFKYLLTSAGAGLLASGQQAGGYTHGLAFCKSRVEVFECAYLNEPGEEKLRVSGALTVSPTPKSAPQPFIVILDMRMQPDGGEEQTAHHNVTTTWLQAIAITASLAQWERKPANLARQRLTAMHTKNPWSPPKLGFMEWA